MPHLAALTWDEDDRLRSTARQAAAAAARRRRPTTPTTPAASGCARRPTGRPPPARRPAGRPSGSTSARVEIYREYAADGTTITLERETLHVTDGDRPSRWSRPGPPGPTRRPRSSCATSTATIWARPCSNSTTRSNIISYEEYFPFGSTSYQAVASQTDLPKRYRYTGKERDEENDLYYHGARYYAPWLGRWTSCDPAGIAAGLDSYLYAHANPVRLIDPGGMQPETPLELPEEIIYVQGTYDDLTSAIARGITRPEKSREQFAAELARERPYGDDPYSQAVQSVWDQDPVQANQQWQDYVTQRMAEEHAEALRTFIKPTGG